MSQALTEAIERTSHDLLMARLAKNETAKLESRLAELFQEQAAETEKLLTILHGFDALIPPRARIVPSFPTGEERFRCRTCDKLIKPGRTRCDSCKSEDLRHD